MNKTTTYITVLTIAIIVVFTACSSSESKTDNSEKLTKFLANFETLKLPFESAEVKEYKAIGNEFLDILTDTAGGFSRNNPEGKLHFETEYYYFKKIPTENKNYHIIIVGELPYTAVWEGMDGVYLETKLYTISAKGDIISKIPLAYYYEGENSGMTASINENIQIITKFDKLITNYKIEQDGTIVKVSETKEEVEYTINEFIDESFKPEGSVFNSERDRMINFGISEEQLMFIATEYKADIDEKTCYKPVILEMQDYTIILLTYRDDEKESADLLLTDKSGKIIIQKQEIYYWSNSEKGFVKIEPLEDNNMLVTCEQENALRIEGEIEITSTFEYFQIDENGKLTEIDEPKAEQYSIIAAYTSFNWDKFYYYTFKTNEGKEFTFKGKSNEAEYNLVYQDANNPGGIEEPEMLNKKIKIQFHSEKSDGENASIVTDYFIIDKIEIVK